MHVHPTSEQAQRFASADVDGPIVMLNLLRFRERAAGDEGMSGQESYQRYGQRFQAMQERYGATPIYIGEPKATVIGPPDEEWDLMVVVEYPSLEAMVTMTQDPDYLEMASDRTNALLDSRLVLTTPVFRA